MIDDQTIWRNFFTPTSDDLPRVLQNGSAEEPIWTTTEAHIGRPDPKLPSLSTYLGLFACLLLFLLALLIVMLYRMKHTIAPLPSDVENAGQTEMFPEDGSEVSICSAD